VQLTTLLFIGRFLADPTDVPTEVVDSLAEQLDIADPSFVKELGAVPRRRVIAGPR